MTFAGLAIDGTLNIASSYNYTTINGSGVTFGTGSGGDAGALKRKLILTKR